MLVLTVMCTKTSRLSSSSDKEARRRLAAIVVIRWSKEFTIIFIIFGLPCTSCVLMKWISIFSGKKSVSLELYIDPVKIRTE
jgi:hypothetical protein